MSTIRFDVGIPAWLPALTFHKDFAENFGFKDISKETSGTILPGDCIPSASGMINSGNHALVFTSSCSHSPAEAMRLFGYRIFRYMGPKTGGKISGVYSLPVPLP